MSRRVIFLPEVTRDYADAFAYYEALSPAAALRFDDFESCARSPSSLSLSLSPPRLAGKCPGQDSNL